MLEDGLIQNKKTQSKHKHVKMLSPLLDLSICPQVPSRPQASDLLVKVEACGFSLVKSVECPPGKIRL